MIQTDSLPYDTPAYAAALGHLGRPFVVPEWPVALLRSPIPGEAELCDALGPWPYCTPPAPEQIPAVYAALQREGLVTFRAFFRPDGDLPDQHLRENGFMVNRLKDHFVFDPAYPLPEHGPKTRANIRRGQRLWEIKPVSLADHLAAIAGYHEELTERKQFSAIAAVDLCHLVELARVPGVQVLGAFDGEGLGAALVSLHGPQSVHFHLLAGAERAYRTCAFYAIYQAAVDLWGGNYCLYMGGAPSSPNGPGIAHFKSRFANRTTPVYIAQAVLDPQACDRLTGAHPPQNPNWFPPYRG